MKFRLALAGSALLALALIYGPAASPVRAQANSQATKKGKSAAKSAEASTAQPQKLDEEYTKLIKEYLQDSRITTEG